MKFDKKMTTDIFFLNHIFLLIILFHNVATFKSFHEKQSFSFLFIHNSLNYFKVIVW